MNQSQINFIVKTLGADEAAREFAKIEAAAQKAGTTVKKYLSSAAGQQQMLALQTRAASARADEQAVKTQKVADATDRASRSQASYFGHIARTTVQSALINKLFLEFVDVSGQAIQQVDLMNNFPATMASMGESTAEASQAMDALRTYVGQVGGNLGDATSMVTRFTGATKDVKAATAIFVGLNNALIAGDSSMEEQRQAAIQFAQALERGKPDMREWRTLTQNMSFQLQQVATSMGYVNANALGEALTTGKESMAAFTTALTKLATGTGDIAQQARARMNGMQFSFNVLKNTMVQGLAAIINTIGRENIVSFFSFLTQVIQVLTGWVLKLITALVTLFNFFAKLFGLPTIKLQKDMAGVAQSIGAGAGAADDLGNGLDDANDSAKKLNKSLASFDKMNVLPDKTSGSGKAKDAGAGGSNFDAGQLGELGNLFGDIGGNLQEVSKWAKIFGGVLAGIAGIKFAQAIIDQIAGITNSFKTAKNGLGAFKNAIFGTTDETGKKVGGLAQSLGQIPTIITGSFDGLKGSFASLGKFLTNPYVLLAAAIAAVVAGTIYLYNTNKDFKEGFDSVWKPIIESLKMVEKIIVGSLVAAFKYLKKALEDAFRPMYPVLKPIIDFFKEIGKWIADTAKKLGLLDSPMKTLGKVMGVVAAVLAVNILAPILVVIGGIVAAVGVVVGVIVGLVWVIKKIWHVWQDTWTKVNEITQTVWQAIQATWDGITEFFVGLWQGIYAIFMGAWNWLKEWGLTVLAVIMWPFTMMVALIITIVAGVAEAFVWLWNSITATWSTVYTWFKTNVWDKIVAVFTAAATWFGDKFSAAWEAIKLVWGAVADWFQVNVWDKITAVFSVVSGWFRDVFQAAWNSITAIFGALEGFFKQRWENLKANLSTVASWFRDIFQAAWNNITNIFSNLWAWFRDNVWNRIVGVFSSIGTTIGNAISGAFKGVINTVLATLETMVNGFISSINWAIRTINKLPGVSVKEVPKVSFPRMAKGGIVDQPTAAIIGESGKEAIVPLENNLEWIDKLAAKINTATGGSNQPVQLTVQIGEDKITSQIIDLINEKTQMSGRNTIYV